MDYSEFANLVDWEAIKEFRGGPEPGRPVTVVPLESGYFLPKREAISSDAVPDIVATYGRNIRLPVEITNLSTTWFTRSRTHYTRWARLPAIETIDI